MDANPKSKRNERVGAMMKILSDEPNKLFTLGVFAEKFGVAKSTVSEDVDLLESIMSSYSLGRLETLPGASGGVKYLPEMGPQAAREFIQEVCQQLSDPKRILTGGYLYMLDILSHPAYVARMGEILAMWFAKDRPNFVLTVETKGIPVAFMVAKTLNIPLWVARRDARITDGTAVMINYITGGASSARRIQTMSLPKRAIKEGQRALIIDDFCKAGGSVRGLCELMREFMVTVAGIGVVMATPERRSDDVRSLMTLHGVDESTSKVDVRPSSFLE